MDVIEETEVITEENLLEKTELEYRFLDIPQNTFFSILFEMNRYFDKSFVQWIREKNLKLTQDERNALRKYFYYGDKKFLAEAGVKTFPQYVATEEDKCQVLISFDTRTKKYDAKKIIKSIQKRYQLLHSKNMHDNSEVWLNWYEQKREKFAYSLFVFEYSMSDFIADNFSIDNILKTIQDSYARIENYRYFVFKLEGKLFNEQNEDVTWQTLYKASLYAENFMQVKNFAPFNQNKRKKKIKKLASFLEERFSFSDDKISDNTINQNAESLAEEFYQNISTGYKFSDCLISETQNNILLIFQKITLDENPIPCPACMSTIQNGNSYPEMFMKSYECKNPHCPERSKSGRGKRFTEYSAYRYFKLSQKKAEDEIDLDILKKWRKDVFADRNDIDTMLIKLYSFSGETVCFTKEKSLTENYKRKISLYKKNAEKEINQKENAGDKSNKNKNAGNPNNEDQNKSFSSFESLPIYQLFYKINKLINFKHGSKKLSKQIEVFNQNSKTGLAELAPNQIGSAITSPPYYNAREYSTWENLIFYLIDMMDNAKTVYNSLIPDAFYFYNIGDIVSQDNIYINSNMSKRRLQLGFLSALVFEIAGFNLVGNIIWDKGEVQSKRNSTTNNFPLYVKCINVYEHVLVFKKGRSKEIISSVKKITPVIKINCKGENIAKHTAPYPLELVELLKPYAKDYALDPFLGSGTTLLWCKQNNFKGVGFEINKEYFELAKENIENYQRELF
ncbi:MAG: DNA methylase [Spirochaetes bacterium ADurb.Bin133]|nr:MAG: DNA methylase [Spirochaetes bacterium ADurb.Bin133]